MYFWGANAQTALFGYLQGRKSLTDEQRGLLVKRQYIYVSDVQYLTSNKDLSKFYEKVRLNNKLNSNEEINANNNKKQQQQQQQLEFKRHIKVQLRAANLQHQQEQQNQHLKYQHDVFHLNQLHKQDDSSRFDHRHQQHRSNEQQHENIRLALEQQQQSKVCLQIEQQETSPSCKVNVEMDEHSEHKSSKLHVSSPPIRLDESGSAASCFCSASSSDSGVFGGTANNSGQASSISSSSGHSSSSSRASTSSLHVLPQHQTTIPTTTSTAITTKSNHLAQWVDLKQEKLSDRNKQRKSINSSGKGRASDRKPSDSKKKLTLFDVYSANKQLDKERLEFGQCALDWFVSSHKNYHKNKLVALISAGMTSGSDKRYVTDTVQTLESLGYECCVFIRRGVGGLKLSSAKFFSPAKWRDFEAAVQSVRQQRPDARLVAVGFSFGSIELCRYLAMSGHSSHIDSALLVSCPFDPVCGGENMHNGSYLNRRIDAYLAKNLGKQLYEAMFATPPPSNSSSPQTQSPTSSCSNLSSLDELTPNDNDKSTLSAEFKPDCAENRDKSQQQKQDHQQAAKAESNKTNVKRPKSIFVIRKRFDKIMKLTTKRRRNRPNGKTQDEQSHLEEQIWTNENGSSINLASLPKLKSLHDFEYGFNRIVQHYPTREAYAQDCELDLSTIAVPTLCLSSEDDFMAPKHLLPIEQVEANPNLCMLLTKRGGHMAFVDGLVWPTKPYFAQRIISDYMGALRNKFMQQHRQQQNLLRPRTQRNGQKQQQSHNLNQATSTDNIANQTESAAAAAPAHIAINLHHHHHHHHHYIQRAISQQVIPNQV